MRSPDPTDAPSPLASRSPWAARLGYLGGALLGAVLLVAAYAKAIDPSAFAEQIRREGLAWFGSPFAWGVGVVALEVALGAALLLGLRRRAVLWPATALVGLFVFLTARTYWRVANGVVSEADAASCGCFGNLIERSPAQAFWQDVLMLVPALALAWVGRAPADSPAARRSRTWRSGFAGLLGAAAGAFAALAPGLPLDDLATRLGPGTRLADLCAGRDTDRICVDHLVPALKTGRHWVVLADVRDADFTDLAGRLNRAVTEHPGSAIAVLADFTQEEQMQLFWRVAPAFDLHEVPAAVLRPLYRQLPRTALVEDGRVVRTYSGLPAELGSPAGPDNRSTEDRQP